MAETQPQTAPPATQPDLTGAEQPGVAAAPQTLESATPVGANNATAANAPAYGEPGAAEQPSTVVPTGQPVAQPAKPVKHAALLALIQGMADGLAGLSEGMASKGRVSGAEVVSGLEAQRQQARQSASAEARAQQDADLRNKMTTAQTNQVLTQTHMLNATMQDEMALKHTQAQEEATKFAGEQFNLFANTGMSPDQIATLVKGGPTDAKTSNMLQANAQQNYRIAEQLLPPTNPALTTLKGLLADPNTPPAALIQANNRLQSELKGQEGITDAKIKAATAAADSPVAKLSTPEALAAPGSQAAIQAKIDDPKTDPNDIPRLRALIPQAAVAQLNAANIKAREQRNQQIVNQGDPADAGRLLADRSLTLEEIKSRNVTPAFIDASVAAAQKIDPNFKAPEAAAQSRIAASPANSQFFGNTDSLLVRGGTLDQLAQAHAALGNTKLPFANKLENWTKAAVGSGPQAAFAASALGVADDYSKVISGGAGSDSSRQQALDIIGRDLSPEGMAASLKQIRSTITSQRNGRISTNPYLAHMYPDPSTRQETAGVAGTQPAAPAGASSEVWVGSKLTGHVVNNKYVPLGQ